MAIRKTLVWMVVLLISAGGVGVRYAYQYWAQRNAILCDKIRKTIREIAPEWKIDLRHACFDPSGIRLFDFKVKCGDDQTPFAHNPEAVVVVDPDQIAENKLLLHQVRLLRPHLVLIQRFDGTWNWEGLPPIPKMTGSPPEWRIEQGIVTVRLEGPAAANPTILMFEGVNLHLVPSGKLRYDIKGVMTSKQAGRVSVEGHVNLDTKTWSFEGDLNSLRIGDDLVRLAVRLFPGCREKLCTTFAEWNGTGPAANGQLPRLGVDATADIHFRVNQWKPESELEYEFAINLTAGRVTNPRLPFPLEELRGRIKLDNRWLVVTSLSLKNGDTQFHLRGKASRAGRVNPAAFEVTIRDLPLDNRLRAWLPPAIRESYESVRPTGFVDLVARIEQDGAAGIGCKSAELTVKRGTASHVKFPYPIEAINGKIVHVGDRCELALRGLAGRHPITINGLIDPHGKTEFDIRVKQFPLDDAFRAAAKPLGTVQSVVRKLDLRGIADIDFTLSRDQPTAKFQPRLAGTLREGSVYYEHFPYALTNFSGKVSLVDGDWEFTELQAQHDGARLTGLGSYKADGGKHRLDLTVSAEGAAFDKSLKAALPEKWKKKWDDLDPNGRLDLVTRVLYVPGESLVVNQERMNLIDAGFVMKSFPVPLQHVTAALKHEDGKLTIQSLRGKYEDADVAIKGWAETSDDGEWRLTLEELHVDDLSPNRRFRSKLPPGLREVVDHLDPRDGTVDITGWLQFRGKDATHYTTAAWDVVTVYSGAAATAGVDLLNMHGRVHSRGLWDGRRVDLTGYVDLESLTIYGYQFTKIRGPISIHDKRLEIGTRTAKSDSDAKVTPLGTSVEDRITANAIGGQFTLGGTAQLDRNADYRILLTIKDARLETYAQLYMPSQQKLHGRINGSVELNGRGASRTRHSTGSGWGNDLTGEGAITISPAALYDLPVVVALLKVFKGAVVDKTAFNRADVLFSIANRQVLFNRIDLIGDAVNFRGKGFVKFDGKVQLDFYSQLDRNRIPIPVVKQVIGAVTKDWVGVKITNTVNDPKSETIALPKVDEALKRFLDALEPRQLNSPQYQTVGK